MKRTEREELKSMSQAELATKVDVLRRELFSVRLHTATRPVKDTATFRKMKKDIARVLTLMRQNEQSA